MEAVMTSEATGQQRGVGLNISDVCEYLNGDAMCTAMSERQQMEDKKE